MDSWVEGADDSGFGLENLPFGAVAVGDGPTRPAVRIGEHALILEPLVQLMMFWVLFVTGCLFAALAGAAAIAGGLLDVPLGADVTVTASVMGVLSPFFLWRSFRFLWKLTRNGSPQNSE